MHIAIKKVGKRDGKERFVLLNNQTREVITLKDVSESSLRRFFADRGTPAQLVSDCLERARSRYADAAKSPAVNEASETMGEDDLLFELGLDESGR